MIQLIENINDLEQIKNGCNNLADKIKMPLLRFEWIKNCTSILSPNEKIKVFVLIEENEIRAIAPLVLKRNFLFERLEIIGASLHKEPTGILYENEYSLFKLLSEIINFGYPVYLNGIRANCTETAWINSICNDAGIHTLMKNADILYLPVYESWEKFESSISPSRRSSLRRLERVANNMGKLKVEMISPAVDEVDNYLNEIFNVEASNWKKRMGTAIQYNSKLNFFFHNYIKDSAELGFLRLCYLRINDIAIAVQVGIEYANRFWLLKIGFNEEWSKCSPGIILMHEVIRTAFEKKLDSIEFLGSDEPWLHIWTDKLHDLVSYTIYRSPITAASDIAVEFSNSIYERIHFKIAKNFISQNRKLSHA